MTDLRPDLSAFPGRGGFTSSSRPGTRSGLVALLIRDLAPCFYGVLAKGVQDAAFARGYMTVFVSATQHGAPLEVLERYGAEGLVVVPTPGPDPSLEELGRRMPIVEVGGTSGSCRPAVLLDPSGAISQAVDHLVALGHRRVGLISNDGSALKESGDHQGFVDRLAHHGLALDPALVGGAASEADGVRAARRLLALDGCPTALVVRTSEALAGVVLATRSLGVRLPQDLSVVGLEDDPWARLHEPALTVVAAPAYEMGGRAGHLLIDWIKDRPLAPSADRIHRLPSTLLVRQSTAPFRKEQPMTR